MKYDLNKICDQIEKSGYCFIDKFWSDEVDREIEIFYQNDLKPLINKTNVDKFGNRNFSLADDEINNNPFNKIKKSKEFINLCENILKINNIQLNKPLEIHNVIALQKNETNTNYEISSKLHFDAFYLTMIIPIKKTSNVLPDTGGSLILYPNLRNISRYSIINYLIKFLVQNSLARYLFSKNFFKKILKHTIVSTEKNKFLVFYGYRTLHGNKALTNQNLKVHSIFHVYNPHQNSGIDKFVFKRNKKARERKLID